jgi:hypothetical protein
MMPANRWPAISTLSSSKQTFRNIEKTLAEAGAKLKRHGDHDGVFERRAPHHPHDRAATELFGGLPASAAITVQGFAQPEMLIEVRDRGRDLKRGNPAPLSKGPQALGRGQPRPRAPSVTATRWAGALGLERKMRSVKHSFDFRWETGAASGHSTPQRRCSLPGWWRGATVPEGAGPVSSHLRFITAAS